MINLNILQSMLEVFFENQKKDFKIQWKEKFILFYFFFKLYCEKIVMDKDIKEPIHHENII